MKKMAKINKSYNWYFVTFHIHNFEFPKYWSFQILSPTVTFKISKILILPFLIELSTILFFSCSSKWQQKREVNGKFRYFYRYSYISVVRDTHIRLGLIPSKNDENFMQSQKQYRAGYTTIYEPLWLRKHNNAIVFAKHYNRVGVEASVVVPILDRALSTPSANIIPHVECGNPFGSFAGLKFAS